MNENSRYSFPLVIFFSVIRSLFQFKKLIFLVLFLTLAEYWFLKIESATDILSGYGMKSQVGVMDSYKHINAINAVQGYLAYGPYLSLTSGKYKVQYKILLDRSRLNDEPSSLVGYCDVNIEGYPKMGSSKEFTVADFKKNNPLVVTLKFSVPEGMPRTEYRVYQYGDSKLSLVALKLYDSDIKKHFGVHREIFLIAIFLMLFFVNSKDKHTKSNSKLVRISKINLFSNKVICFYKENVESKISEMRGIGRIAKAIIVSVGNYFNKLGCRILKSTRMAAIVVMITSFAVIAGYFGYKILNSGINILTDQYGMKSQFSKYYKSGSGYKISSDATTPQGFLVYGPYISLEEGNYAIRFKLRLNNLNDEDPSEKMVVACDVSIDKNPDKCVSKELKIKDFRQSNPATKILKFSIPAGKPACEFRVFLYYGNNLTVEEIKLHPKNKLKLLGLIKK